MVMQLNKTALKDNSGPIDYCHLYSDLWNRRQLCSHLAGRGLKVAESRSYPETLLNGSLKCC